jgi:hypothetical protein
MFTARIKYSMSLHLVPLTGKSLTRASLVSCKLDDTNHILRVNDKTFHSGDIRNPTALHKRHHKKPFLANIERF